MTLPKVDGSFPFIVTIAAGLSLLGCCKEEEEKAAALSSKITQLQSEISGLKTQVETLTPLEKKLETCELALEDASTALGRRTKQEALMEKQQTTMRRLLDKLKGVIEAGDLSVRIRRGRMVIELPSAVLFDSGKADLSEKGKETLDSVADGSKR